MTRENLPAGWHIAGEQPAASDGDGGRSYQAALDHQARKRGEDKRECAVCGDQVGYLSSHDLCDGCEEIRYMSGGDGSEAASRDREPTLARCPQCQRLACGFCFEIHCEHQRPRRPASDNKPRCAICGLRVERVTDSAYPDAGRLAHLGTVAGMEAERDHKPKLKP